MNYYAAREIQDESGRGTGRWHYTCRNDHRIWPVGYCNEGCPGHDTPEEANQHMTAYVLDTGIDLSRSLSNEQRKCEVCGAWTQGVAEVRGPWCVPDSYVLCDEHRTDAKVRELFGDVGNVTSS
jgi:hypothetical protein